MKARRLCTAVIAIGGALTIAACSSSAPSTTKHATSPSSGGGSSKHLLIGFANVTGNDPTLSAMETVLTAQAHKRGWDTLILNNNLDGPTALKNADTMVTKHVDYAIEFQVDNTVQPVIAKKLASAKIPEIVYDIPAPGAYFIGAPNTLAGQLAGHKLGEYAKATWNCQPDLVIDIEQVTAGLPSKLRTDGVRAGLKQVCPNIPESVIVQKDGGASATTAQAAGRDILSAHPAAKKILLGGLNDTNVVGVINAATQLNRAAELYAWGTDGGLLLAGSFPPQLKGSVAFFLDGYPLLALQLIDKLAAGQSVPIGDTPTSANADFVKPCVVSAAQANSIPPVAKRATQLEAAPASASAYDLFCPNK